MERTDPQPSQPTPGNPPWLQSQLADRAADQMNQCITIADNLHAQGKTHHDNPTWQAAAIESHRLITASGVDVHDIGAEATRRRTPGGSL